MSKASRTKRKTKRLQTRATKGTRWNPIRISSAKARERYKALMVRATGPIDWFYGMK